MNYLTKAMTSLLATAATLSAQGLTLPTDLNPGDPYRLIYVTASARDALSTDIADYNAHVTADAAANPDLAALGANWTAVCSTETVVAPDNTQTNPTPPGSTGVPIYNPDGVRVADDYDQLWSGSLLASVTPAGSPSVVWTGTSESGEDIGHPLGGTTPSFGRSDLSTFHWMRSSHFGAGGGVAPRSLYGMSDILTVPLPPPSDLSPGDSYRILVVTDFERDALTSDIADYNAFAVASVYTVHELAELNVEWRAVAGTATVSARDNTGTNATAPGIQGVPIYLRDGTRVADNYDDFWDGSLAATPNIAASGVVLTGHTQVWTGTFAQGASGPSALGGSASIVGVPSLSSPGWIAAGLLDSNQFRRIYALSAVLTVPQPAIETVRVGSLPNPNVFLPGVTSGPVIGQTWDPVLDHTNFSPNATFDFLLIAGTPLDLDLGPVSSGHLLCDIDPWHVAISNLSPGTPFSLSLPNALDLVGDTYCVQGGSVDMQAPFLHFANAIDITIGMF